MKKTIEQQRKEWRERQRVSRARKRALLGQKPTNKQRKAKSNPLANLSCDLCGKPAKAIINCKCLCSNHLKVLKELKGGLKEK